MPGVVALVDELMMRSRIESACHARGWPVEFPRDVAQFWAVVRDHRPQAILIGASATRMPWETLVQELKQDAELSAIPVIAFGRHTDLELRRRALAAGCDRVVANSQIATDLPGLIAQVQEASVE